MADLEIQSASVQETVALGERIGQGLQGGEVFAVTGPLGSGKTHLIKGIVRGCGHPDQDPVSSPTFVLVNEYEGRFRIYHIDAYRLRSAQEFEMLGFEEILDPGAVVLIEWADKVAASLQSVRCIHIHLEHMGPSCRSVRLEGLSDALVARVRPLLR
ncbi:MAG: tRNA (adenosine(37)-N6)-threonylcarbamoyltransferase complex ATPase subunit type 1 TsaE [Phycisphaerae bacterium]|nr:tRNA (adenosine(37)-N6)-threonylcarbamoyltransferase complex ATPase subunit type 1 TsaE [Phycisphaerae bacterium]